MARYSKTRITSRSVRFYDQANTSLNIQNIEESMTAEQILYLGTNNGYTSNSKTVTIDTGSNTITFEEVQFATPPSGFPAQTKKDFVVFINGVSVEFDAIDSIVESGDDVVITVNNALNFDIEQDDEYMITGKLA